LGCQYGFSLPWNRDSQQQLGRRIAALLTDPHGIDFPGRPSNSRPLAQVQDLLGAETTLLAPQRDLLLRPSFRSLLTLKQPAARLAGRDALLQELEAV
jgi:hypothetical protein